MQPVPWRHSHPHNMRLAVYHYFFPPRLSLIVEDYALMMMCGNSTLFALNHLRHLTDGGCDGIFVGERVRRC